MRDTFKILNADKQLQEAVKRNKKYKTHVTLDYDTYQSILKKVGSKRKIARFVREATIMRLEGRFVQAKTTTAVTYTPKKRKKQKKFNNYRANVMTELKDVLAKKRSKLEGLDLDDGGSIHSSDPPQPPNNVSEPPPPPSD